MPTDEVQCRAMDRAGFFFRLMAQLIDAIAIVGIVYGAEYFFWERIYFAALDASHEERAYYLFPLIQYGIVLLYTTLDVVVAATPGKLLFRLRIANADGTRPPVSRLILRWLTKYQPLIYFELMILLQIPALEFVAAMTWWIVGIGCLYAMCESRLTWHDEWAGTSVVWASDADPQPSVRVPVSPPVGAS